jgi:hypothetical protein
MPEAGQGKQVDAVDFNSSQTNPLIFISHDSRDAELAEAFSKLLSSVSCGVLKSFRSSDRRGSQGIEYGIEWYPEIMKNLATASDVVCLLTQRSTDRPWILYEAGVAKGKLNTPVYGIALGIPLGRASGGPFAQFQNCDDDEESITKLVMQLVRRIPNSDPDHDAIQMQVRTFKQRVSEILKTLAQAKPVAAPATPPVDETSVAKLFEEVKLMFKDLPSRVDSKLSEAVDASRHQSPRRVNRVLLDEYLQRAVVIGDGSLAILIAISAVRDEAPWLYELGLDLCKQIDGGQPSEMNRATIRFRSALGLARSSPLVDSEETYMAVRAATMALERFSPFGHDREHDREKVVTAHEPEKKARKDSFPIR